MATVNKHCLLFVHSNNIDIGGSDLMLAQLVEQCQLEGYRCQVVLSKQSGIEHFYEERKIPVKWISMPRLSKSINPFLHLQWLFQFIASSIQLTSFFRKMKASLVIGNDYNELPALVAARFSGIPSIVIIRFIFPKIASIRSLYMFLLTTFASKVACVSRAVEEANFHDLPFSLRKKVMVLYDWFAPKSEPTAASLPDLFQHLQIPPHAKIVLMPGRKEPWKGQHVLIEAIPSVLVQVPNAFFLFIGSAVAGRGREQYEESLRQRARELGVENHVRLIDHQKNLSPWLERADALVHCSIQPEPFGLTVLEALGFGVPLLTTKAGGPLEIVGSPPAALLHQLGNSIELADCIIRLLTDSSLASELKKRGKERALFFSKEQRWPAFELLFKQLFLDEKISSQVRTVTSQELDGLIDQLIEKIELAGFSPDFLVYLETGARQPALIFFEKTQIPLIPLTIQRPGKAAKNKLGRCLNFLPRGLLNFLRTVESIFIAPLLNRREIFSPPLVDLRGKKILIFDDASDSGQSILLAKDWVLEKEASELKAAAITITTVKAQQAVDYFIYRQPCRFPWSLDAVEKTPVQTL